MVLGEFLGVWAWELFFCVGERNGGRDERTVCQRGGCRGWMALHNPENRRKVTGELSTMEFSIAMLASGGWTNKEIGEHLGISINTVKHYLTDIFCKLNVKKRDELKKFMLK